MSPWTKGLSCKKNRLKFASNKQDENITFRTAEIELCRYNDQRFVWTKQGDAFNMKSIVF